MAKAIKITDSQHRLKEMMQSLHINQTELCKRTGIQKSTMSNFVNGRREPNRDSLFAIADPYHINPAWLMGYDVEMYLGTDYDKSIKDIVSKVNEINSDAMQLLIEFNKLNKNGKKELMRYIAYMKTVSEYKNGDKQ